MAAQNRVPSISIACQKIEEIEGVDWFCFELKSETSSARWIRVHSIEELKQLHNDVRAADRTLIHPLPLGWCGGGDSRREALSEFAQLAVSNCFSKSSPLYANEPTLTFFDICNPWRAAAANDEVLLMFLFQQMKLPINIRDSHNITPLHLTYVMGLVALSRQIEALGGGGEGGADRDRNGHLPAEAAAAAGQTAFSAIEGGSPVLEAYQLTLGKGYREHCQLSNRLLVFVNPFSGTKKALRTYRDSVLPILRLAGMNIEYRETQNIGHASDEIKAWSVLDLLSFRCIITVSGDGVLNEVVHGMMSRPDAAQVATIPVGIIPAGSGNGMAKSLDAFDPHVASQRIVHGFSLPLDVACLQQVSKPMSPPTVRYSILSLTWGIISDVDLESEKWRSLGSMRFTLAAVIKLMQGNFFPARLSILPATWGAGGNIPFDGERTRVSAPRSDVFKPSPIGEHWVEINDDFMLFIAANTPWVSSDTCLAPSARFGDGCFDIVMARHHRNEAIHGGGADVVAPTRSTMLGAFLQLEKDTWMEDAAVAKIVEAVKVTAFKIEPLPVRPGERTTVYSIDGERAEDNMSAIEANVLRSALSIMGADLQKVVAKSLHPRAGARV